MWKLGISWERCPAPNTSSAVLRYLYYSSHYVPVDSIYKEWCYVQFGINTIKKRGLYISGWSRAIETLLYRDTALPYFPMQLEPANKFPFYLSSSSSNDRRLRFLGPFAGRLFFFSFLLFFSLLASAGFDSDFSASLPSFFFFGWRNFILPLSSSSLSSATEKVRSTARNKWSSFVIYRFCSQHLHLRSRGKKESWI